MKPTVGIVALIVTLACSGCARDPAPEVEQDQAGSSGEAAPAPAGPELLPRPFTAEQIRDEWVEGFSLDVEISNLEGISLQRWTVIAADDEGAQIENAILDATGAISATPQLQRVGWVELRDHATFRARDARRERVTRVTPLGELDGWLYTVQDRGLGGASVGTAEYFFASSLPGAPLHVIKRQGDLVIEEMKQLARRRPE